MINPEILFDKVKKDIVLSNEEKKYILAQMKKPNCDYYDFYRILRVFGMVMNPSKENILLLENYFSPVTDDWVLHGVIQVIDDWKLTKNYLNELLFYLEPKTWKTYFESSKRVFKILGNYIYDSGDKTILSNLYKSFKQGLKEHQKILDEFDDLEDTDKENETLESLYTCLKYSINGRKALIDNVGVTMLFPDDIDEGLLNQIENSIG